MTPDQFQNRTGVSRETLERLEIYSAELYRWNKAINLVSKRTLPEVWQRHFLDSWQLLDGDADLSRRWVDLGSGGGFPALVLAACGVSDITLVESDIRKGTFLREAARKMDVTITVLSQRVEACAPQNADIISARAFAPLHRLMEYAEPHLQQDGQLRLLKGQDVEAELTEATKYWTFDIDRRPSLSDAGGTVLTIKDVNRV